MVKIRLRRVGAKKQPSYRVVITDSRSPRDGRFIENVGFYNPRTEPPTVEIKEDRALYWLSQGAQPTDAVAGLLTRQGTMERLARYKSGESLDVLLAEAAAEREQLAEKASEPEVQAEAQEIAEAAATEVEEAAEIAEAEEAAEIAEAETEAKEVVADSETNIEATDDVADTEESLETAEEEA
jgi:small subunit ribosomal protein S16